MHQDEPAGLRRKGKRDCETARTIITAAAAALAAGPADGQDNDVVQWYEWQTGRVWDGSGWVVIETVEQALHPLTTMDDMSVATGPVDDIIAGNLLDLTETRRNDLADRLGEMILADTTEAERVARLATWTCASWRPDGPVLARTLAGVLGAVARPLLGNAAPRLGLRG